MFSPLGVSLHMFCTQILLCTQHQHAHTHTGTHTETHTEAKHTNATYVTVQAFCATACATLSHKSEHILDDDEKEEQN